MNTKKCPKCGKELPVSSFGKSKKSKDGLYWYCLQCKRDYNRLHSQSGSELCKFTDFQLITELKVRGYEIETKRTLLIT